MKKIKPAFLIVFGIIALIGCSQATYVEKTVTLTSIKNEAASYSVGIVADNDADAYVLADGSYVSVTKASYDGKFGKLDVSRSNSVWKVTYTGTEKSPELKSETIAVEIGTLSGNTLSKKFGKITATCNVSYEPVEDELDITTAAETLVLGTPDAGNLYHKAVLNRLTNRVSTFNENTTKAIVVFSTAFTSLSEEEKGNLVTCWNNNGDIVAIDPDVENFLKNTIPQLKEKFYNEEVIKHETEGFSREDWVKYRGETLLRISDEDKAAISKAVVYSVGFHNGNNYIMRLVDDTVETDYSAGLMADGLAKWINTTTAGETKGSSLPEISDAEIQTKNYGVTVKRCNDDGDYTRTYSNVIENIITAYTEHAISDNRDWYQVEQKITFKNASIKPVYDINDNEQFWVGYHNGEYSYWIDSLGYFDNTVYLKGINGNVVVYDSHPQSANSSHSSSCATSPGKTHPIVDSGSGGLLAGFCGKGVKSTFAKTFGHRITKTESTSNTVGTSMTINDISVIKTSLDDGGFKKTKWTYDFAQPSIYTRSSGVHWYLCWSAPKLGLTDCTQKNSLLYYVDKPSGAATVCCDNDYRYYFIWSKGGKKGATGTIDGGNQYNFSTTFTLKQPMRYYESWGISCIEYGDIKDSPLLISMFEERITNDIIGGVNNKFNDIGGVDKNDLSEANTILEIFIKDFANQAASYKASGFTGKYTFQLKAVDTGRVITKSYTI